MNHTLQNPPLGTVVDSEATRPEWQVLFENLFLIKHLLCFAQVWPYFVCLLSHFYFIFPSGTTFTWSARLPVGELWILLTITSSTMTMAWSLTTCRDLHSSCATCTSTGRWVTAVTNTWLRILKLPTQELLLPLCPYTWHNARLSQWRNEWMNDSLVHSGGKPVCHRNEIEITTNSLVFIIFRGLYYIHSSSYAKLWGNEGIVISMLQTRKVKQARMSGGKVVGLALFCVPVHEAKGCSQNPRPRFLQSPLEH